MGLGAPLSFPHGLQPLFWPLSFTDEGLSPIVSEVFDDTMGTDVFCLGNFQGTLFGSPNFRSGVIFLRSLC